MPCYVQPIKGPTREEFAEWRKLGYTGDWEQYRLAKERGGGGTMFICGDLGDHCADCNALGEYLCDYPVGEGKTCDRPLCDTHRHEIGVDLHYCEAHHQMWQEFKDGGGVDAALRNVIAYKAEK